MSKVVFYSKYAFESFDLQLLGKLVGCMSPVDRQGNMNFLDMEYDEIPSDWKNFRKSFTYCCYDRAAELWLKDKPLEVFWSGGIDSTVVLLSLLETKPDNRHLNVRYDKNSAAEFPELYTKVVSKLSPAKRAKDIISYRNFNNHDILKITGECGDQLFGSDALHDKLHMINDSWESILFYNPPDGRDDVKFAEMLFGFVESAPFEIDTIFDLYWWLNFNLKWMEVQHRMLFYYGKCPHHQSTLSFFNTKNFQCWAMQNHKENVFTEWKEYKQTAKDFIHALFPNSTYHRHKTKEPSLIKILEGRTDKERTDDVRDEEKQSGDNIKLVLDNGIYWRLDEPINIDIGLNESRAKINEIY